MSEKNDKAVLIEAMTEAQKRFIEVLEEHDRQIQPFQLQLKGAILDAEDNPFYAFMIPFKSRVYQWFEEDEDESV